MPLAGANSRLTIFDKIPMPAKHVHEEDNHFTMLRDPDTSINSTGSSALSHSLPHLLCKRTIPF